nr:DNA damage-regulated autophagy modulator protein 2 isoform X2 [Halyomorpha halys]
MAPESYVFSLLVNITAYLLGICVYLRYLYVKKYARFRNPRGTWLNKFSAWIGILACFGLDMVANCQVSSFPLPHYIGAFLIFIGGTIYFYMQTAVSYKMIEVIEMPHLHVLRTWLSILSCLLIIVVVACGIAAKMMFPGSKSEERQWLPKDKGYIPHILSAASEWFLVLAHGALLLTFLPSFSCITIKAPVVVIEGITETYSEPIHIISAGIPYQ